MLHNDTKVRLKMDTLIQKMNDLIDICTVNGIIHTIELPQIIVVGSQSSGKSSVLENIVGCDFLPRGSGIVTRRPLILQLVYLKEAGDPYAYFNHKNDRFNDFTEVKREIQAETSREIKDKNDVSGKPITLKIFSSKVLPLTLVDLPGLVKIPTADQPRDICDKIETICKTYISNRNAIILAVTAASTDISTSDSLQLAKSVDPYFDRTIGVLTKLDLMDKGTDIVNILQNRLIKLKFGFIPTINRSQADIESNKSIEEALEFERVFFNTHKTYAQKSEFCGTPYLVSKLNYILHEHIKQCLPSLQEKLLTLITSTETELSEFRYIPLSPKEIVLRSINDFHRHFSEEISGCNFNGGSNEIIGGARINYMLNIHFSKFISELKPLSNLSNENIRTLLYNSNGSSSTSVFPLKAFEKLVKDSILQLKPFSIKLVSIVYNELVRISQRILTESSCSRYPALQEKILGSLIALFKRGHTETQAILDRFIDWNVRYLSTKHPDFVGLADVLSKESGGDVEKTNMAAKCQKQPAKFDAIPQTLRITCEITENEMEEINVMKSLVLSYYAISRKTVIDQVPKAIMVELVSKSQELMQEILFRDVYEIENIDDLCVEDKSSVESRTKVKSTLSALKLAYDLVCSL